MTLALVRDSFAAVAFKIETTPGTDIIAGSPSAGDFFPALVEGTPFNAQTVQDPTLTGSLDRYPSIVGGLQPQITLRIPIRGSGTAGTAPAWGKVLRCCCMEETVTGSAVGAPTAATTGTVNSITLASPFVTTADAYIGMPILLTGDQTTTTGITSYSSGRVAFLGQAVTTPTTSTLAQIPINVRYKPTSDESTYKTATVYVYKDGLRWKFVGFMGTWSLDLPTGGIGFLVVTGRAVLAVDPDATAVPATALGAVLAVPPRFVNGQCQLLRTTARVGRLAFNAGVNLVLPDNPEAVDGYDPAVPISRMMAGTLDPLMHTTSSVTVFNAFKSGVQGPICAIWGTTPGNRFLFVAPQVRQIQNDPTARNGLSANSIAYECDIPDGGAFLTQF